MGVTKERWRVARPWLRWLAAAAISGNAKEEKGIAVPRGSTEKAGCRRWYRAAGVVVIESLAMKNQGI